MTVKNLDELQKLIYKEVANGLNENVFDTVAEKMAYHAFQDVYEAYEPSEYTRRYDESGKTIGSDYDRSDNTGLLDPDNIISKVSASSNRVVMTVENVTKGSRYYYEIDDQGRKHWKVSRNAGKYIAPVIETGKGYDVVGVERPFIRHAARELRNTQVTSKLLKAYLKGKGFKVK